MASAQVHPNLAVSSRKQGHLEAGKKKLEEFRKRKAEERAKKTSSTGQLHLFEGAASVKDFQNEEDEGDGTISSSSAIFNGVQTTPKHKEAFVSTNKDDNFTNESTLMSNSYEKSSHMGLVNGYYDHRKERNDLSINNQSKFQEASTSTEDRFTPLHSVQANANDEEHLESSSLYPALSDESRISYSAILSNSDSFYNTGLLKAEGASVESRMGLASTSLSSSSTFNVGRKTISESINQHLNLEGSIWHTSENSLADSSPPTRRSQEADSSYSNSLGMPFGRSRPSFLDTLGVSKSSTLHVPLYEQLIANPPVYIGDTKVHSADSHFSSPHQQLSLSPILIDENVNSITSSNDTLLLERSQEQQGGLENLVSKKNEEFSALEQHIGDLTQEKFALQNLLEKSRNLTDSLATENSSLTESYNHQAKVVSELRSEIERWKEEVTDQLRAVDLLKLECSNAQLECNAADERAKILASEVIGLEEKVLRLRSNELKLEKKSENLTSEIASYKRKLSIFEKERQDFQFTVNAMQEEKKLLQSKLRKAASNSNVDNTLSVISSRRDMSTATDDLADHIDKHNKEAELMEISNTMSTLPNRAFNASVMITSSLPNDTNLCLSDGSVGIPNDQLRMIDNINSIISELALEKEELMQTLTIEISDSSKLKDLNKELSRKLEAQTQRLELLTAQRMANENILAKPLSSRIISDTMEYADEGDEVVERVLGWIMKFFPGGSSKRRTSKLL